MAMEQPPPPKKQIFILSGQSNMSGRGGVNYDHRHHRKHWDGVTPPECRPHPSILRLSAALRWEEAHEPLHADIDAKKVCGVGPGMVFANALRAATRVGLVPCAVGGTALKEWARGEELYENMVRRAKESVGDGDGEIKGLLWFQGESDTYKVEDAEAYKGKMEELICNVREDLCLPSLPVIQVAITSGDKFVERVREAQLSIKMENVVTIDAKGSELKDDKLHLTTKAQVHLGLLLAHSYLSNFASQPSTCHIHTDPSN